MRIFCMALILLVACTYGYCQQYAVKGFIQTKGTSFLLDGKPYHFIGTSNRYETLASKGVNNLRIMVGAEGEGLINGMPRLGPPLQPAEVGKARPKKGQEFWRNGVFDSNTTTRKLIESSTKKKQASFASVTPRPIDKPIDKKATKQTIQLYHNLKKLLKTGIMFGHQDDLAYGVGWKYIWGKSDVKEVTGDYPGVYGFELGRIELDHPVNIDSVPFDKMRKYIRSIYDRGGVITLSWHLNNPLTGKTAWDPETGTVASILPGGKKNILYKSWLDKVAGFISGLKGRNGEPIPVILRLFHELNGNWFWWGKDHCTPVEFKELWQFTVTYLRDIKNIHQVLYAYNTDRFSSKEDYLLKYPGDDYTDVIGFDIYQREGGDEGNAAFINDAGHMLGMLEEIAKEKNKIPALTEFGYDRVPDSTWFTNVLYKALGHHRISYALAWRNAGLKPSGEAEFYLPYKGQLSEKDFIQFSKEPNILFQKQVTKQHLYK